jgi:hypothetical protein
MPHFSCLIHGHPPFAGCICASAQTHWPCSGLHPCCPACARSLTPLPPAHAFWPAPALWPARMPGAEMQLLEMGACWHQVLRRAGELVLCLGGKQAGRALCDAACPAHPQSAAWAPLGTAASPRVPQPLARRIKLVRALIWCTMLFACSRSIMLCRKAPLATECPAATRSAGSSAAATLSCCLCSTAAAGYLPP